MWWVGTLQGRLTTPSSLPSLTVRVRGTSCPGTTPKMTVSVDGTLRTTTSVTAASWATVSIPGGLAAGTHTISIGFANDKTGAGCDVNLFVDEVTATA